MVDHFTLPRKDCRLKDSKGCWVTFRLEQLVGEDYYYAEILNQRGEECVVTKEGGSLSHPSSPAPSFLELLRYSS